MPAKRKATARKAKPAAKPGPKAITLALQGGGAHGAFAWGALDYLLEDPRLSIEAVSATSAGAMNAAVMAYGVSIGGKQGARDKLAEFWQLVSETGRLYSPVQSWPWEKWLHSNGVHSDVTMSFMAFQAATHALSPYQLNPLNFNPLKDILAKVVDFERLCRCEIATRLYLSATNVRTGKIKVFENADLSADVVLASACLPYLFQAVEIGGEHYWDGGFMGNPAIFPLIYRQGSRDVVIVHINPLERNTLPLTAPEIYDRVNEITFNSSLMGEMRAIAFVARLLDQGRLDKHRYSRMLIHSIRDDDALAGLGVASKFDPDWDFLCRLRDAGRRTAAQWLDTHYEAIGAASTVDLAPTFL